MQAKRTRASAASARRIVPPRDAAALRPGPHRHPACRHPDRDNPALGDACASRSTSTPRSTTTGRCSRTRPSAASASISRLREEQLRVCVADTHSPEAIAAAEPYPHAVETVNRWHDEGHFIHVTSHRADHCHPATKEWLDRIGLQYDELYCSYDKVGRCREIGIDVLIDDSPVNIMSAIDAGMVPATITHPWNQDVCEDEDVICGADWPELARGLDPVLARGDRAA